MAYNVGDCVDYLHMHMITCATACFACVLIRRSLSEDAQ